MEEEELKELKKFILEEYQFYNRRYEQVCLIISGFGLYTCLEFGKIVLDTKQKSCILLFAATGFVLSIILALIRLGLEKRIRGYYLQLFYDNKKSKEEADKKSLRLENKGICIDWWNLCITSLAIILLMYSTCTIFVN